jgi:hypothetical protein
LFGEAGENSDEESHSGQQKITLNSRIANWTVDRQTATSVLGKGYGMLVPINFILLSDQTL